jgi:hypothetical protein
LLKAVDLVSSGSNFKETLEITDPFVASGTIERLYGDPVRMYVGVVQLRRNRETKKLEVTAGAYGMGVPRLTPGPDEQTQEWSMELRPDSAHNPLTPGQVYGLTVLELRGGRVMGWLDDRVDLTARGLVVPYGP